MVVFLSAPLNFVVQGDQHFEVESIPRPRKGAIRKERLYILKPSSSSNSSIRAFRAYPPSGIRQTISIERFEATVSQSTVRSPLLTIPGRAPRNPYDWVFCPASGALHGRGIRDFPLSGISPWKGLPICMCVHVYIYICIYIYIYI